MIIAIWPKLNCLSPTFSGRTGGGPKFGGGPPPPIRVDDASPVHVFHFGGAWEEEEGGGAVDAGAVVFTAVTIAPPFDMTFDRGVWLSNFSEAPGRQVATPLL